MILSVKGTSLTRYFTLVNFILNLSLGSLCFWFLEGDVILNILFLSTNPLKNFEFGVKWLLFSDLILFTAL